MCFNFYKMSRIGNPIERKQIRGCLGLGAVVGECGGTPNEPELSTCNQKNDLKLDCDGGYTSLQKY